MDAQETEEERQWAAERSEIGLGFLAQPTGVGCALIVIVLSFDF